MGSERIHVCHLIHDLGPGGAEQLLVEFAGAAPRAGIRTTVISLMGIDGARNAGRLRDAGAGVLSVGLGTRWDPRAFRRTLRIVRDVRPDVLQTHLKHADTVGSWVAGRLGIPMISTLHRIEVGGTAVDRLKQRVGGRARVGAAARTVAVSEAQRRWYLDAFDADPARVVTVHNGIRRPETVTGGGRTAARDELGVGSDELVATMLGVMRPGKGHAELLAAARLIPPSWRLRIVMAGDGDLAGRISEEVRRDPALAGRVLLPGWCEDVDRLLGASDVLVHPTLNDAFPTAVIHGLAAGLPVVASAVGGVPELVDAEVGILVPPGNPAALAGALIELLGDPQKRAAMGRAARDRFDREYTASAWVGRLGAVYREVLAG
ncbi:MAG TPA: glycosyltransferase [Acidimicrobiales bacterium]|nr:glycosyltransferase [Acidimicrobiales bacterium]